MQNIEKRIETYVNSSGIPTPEINPIKECTSSTVNTPTCKCPNGTNWSVVSDINNLNITTFIYGCK